MDDWEQHWDDYDDLFPEPEPKAAISCRYCNRGSLTWQGSATSRSGWILINVEDGKPHLCDQEGALSERESAKRF